MVSEPSVLISSLMVRVIVAELALMVTLPELLPSSKSSALVVPLLL